LEIVMSDTLAVTILQQQGKDKFVLDFRDVDVRHLETIQVSSSDDLIGLNVVSVERDLKHPLFRLAEDRMRSRIFSKADIGKKHPNGLGYGG
jgi:hypothetical protein